MKMLIFKVALPMQKRFFNNNIQLYIDIFFLIRKNC